MSKFEKLLEEYIEQEVKRRIDNKGNGNNKLRDIVNTIENEILNKRNDIESFKAQGLSLNQLELEGGLRTLLELTDYFNDYVLDDFMLINRDIGLSEEMGD